MESAGAVQKHHWSIELYSDSQRFCPDPILHVFCRYDRADNTFRQLVDMQLVAAMGPPGGGRNQITPRILRHFNVITVNEFEDATYTRIYGAITDW